MAVREPKIRSNTQIAIVGRDGQKKGTLELTPGNLIYARRHGGAETLRLTYQQLVDLLEKEVSYRAVDPLSSMPRGRSDGHDFVLHAWRDDSDLELTETVISASSPLARMTPRRQNDGCYDIDFSIAKGRRSKKWFWQAQISLQAVLLILDHYISRQLENATDRKPLSDELVVSRPQMRTILLRLLKKLGY